MNKYTLCMVYFQLDVNHNKYTVHLNNLNKIIFSLNIFDFSGSPRIKVDRLIVHDVNPQMPFLNGVVIKQIQKYIKQTVTENYGKGSKVV